MITASSPRQKTAIGATRGPKIQQNITHGMNFRAQTAENNAMANPRRRFEIANTLNRDMVFSAG